MHSPGVETGFDVQQRSHSLGVSVACCICCSQRPLTSPRSSSTLPRTRSPHLAEFVCESVDPRGRSLEFRGHVPLGRLDSSPNWEMRNNILQYTITTVYLRIRRSFPTPALRPHTFYSEPIRLTLMTCEALCFNWRLVLGFSLPRHAVSVLHPT